MGDFFMRFDNERVIIVYPKLKKFFKTIIVSIVVILLLNPFSIVYGDELDEDDNENIINEIYLKNEEIIESGVIEKTNPTINSKRYVVYDRKSKTGIYGKDENKQSAMASTTKIMTRYNSSRKM